MESLGPLLNLILVESASENNRKKDFNKRVCTPQYASASTALTNTTRHSSYSVPEIEYDDTTEDDDDENDVRNFSISCFTTFQ